MSESERKHIQDVQRAVEIAVARDAHLRTLGYADSREFSREMRRRAIDHQYSQRYGAWLKRQLGL